MKSFSGYCFTLARFVRSHWVSPFPCSVIRRRMFMCRFLKQLRIRSSGELTRRRSSASAIVTVSVVNPIQTPLSPAGVCCRHLPPPPPSCTPSHTPTRTLLHPVTRPHGAGAARPWSTRRVCVWVGVAAASHGVGAAVSPVVEVVHSVDAKPATCRDRVEDVREVVDGVLRRPAVIACFDVVVLANVVLVLCMVCVRSTLVLCMVSCTVLVRGISVLCCAWFTRCAAACVVGAPLGGVAKVRLVSVVAAAVGDRQQAVQCIEGAEHRAAGDVLRIRGALLFCGSCRLVTAGGSLWTCFRVQLEVSLKVFALGITPYFRESKFNVFDAILLFSSIIGLVRSHLVVFRAPNCCPTIASFCDQILDAKNAASSSGTSIITFFRCDVVSRASCS